MTDVHVHESYNLDPYLILHVQVIGPGTFFYVTPAKWEYADRLEDLPLDTDGVEFIEADKSINGYPTLQIFVDEKFYDYLGDTLRQICATSSIAQNIESSLRKYVPELQPEGAEEKIFTASALTTKSAETKTGFIRLDPDLKL